ncbi:MAG TPA: hypothetical protein VFL76_06670 [Edaphocola sp.]|nr:hypothetical protein [Edaphocola sp.]
MKFLYTVLAVAVLSLAACQNHYGPVGPPPASKDLLINPGVSAGKISIDDNMDSVLALLGKPDRSDAAMGKVVANWYHNHDSAAGQIAVYASRQMGVGDEISRVKKIKITDTAYRTQEGIGTGELLIDIARIFVVRPVDTFRRNNQKFTIFDTQKGMSFIINPKGICDAIILQNPKDSVNTAYLPFY